MATVLAMPSRARKESPAAVPKYRRRTRVIDGRVWEIIERVQTPPNMPAPFGQQLPAPSRLNVRAVA